MRRFLGEIQEWFLSLLGRRFSSIIQSRAELLQVFDGFSDPVIVIDRQFVIQRVNQTTVTSLGKESYKEFVGKPCYVMLHGLKERCPSCTAPITFSSGKKTIRTGFMEAQEKPFETTYSITSFPLTNKKGLVTHIAEYYRDSTEIVALTRELYESERARVMKPLIAGIVHQVRQPLTVIRAAAQYGLGTFKKLLNSSDFNETMESILKSVDIVNDTLIDLLHLSKSSQYQMKKGSLLKLLETGLELVRQKIKNQKISVTRDWQQNLPEVLMDEKLLLQAYLNLLMNSLEAMPQGGHLAVRATYQKGVVPPRIDMIIEDTGKGIPKDIVSRLSRPFFSTKDGGVGLGLPVAEGIIRSHGGQIRFESKENQGTKVLIELPLSS